jgi:putative addiction module component (TIGR02574 family)
MENELLSKILQLSISERIQLVEDIWDSIASIPDAVNLTPDQKEELDRRIAKYRQNPETGIPWAALRDQLLSYK